MISWRSIGKARITKPEATYVRDCLDEQPPTVYKDTSFLDAVAKILENEAVLVLERDKRIAGIVTTHDLGSRYDKLAKPFLLLHDVESRLRLLIDKNFTEQEIVDAKDPRDLKRPVKEASDLSFGEYIRLLEMEDNWKRLGLTNLDRRVFLKRLREVRDVRNDIMHFSPDDPDLTKLGKLRKLLEFLTSS